MVQIPGPESIAPVDPRSGRAVVSGPSVNTGTGLQQLGQDLSTGAANIEAAQKQRNALTSVAVDGNASKDLNDFERTFDTRTDYTDFGSSFNDGARSIRDRYASQIPDTRARQAWVDDFNKRALSSRSRILDRGVAGERDQRIAGAKSGLEGYQSIIADPNATEDARATARKSANSAIAALQQTGDLAAQDAETWNKNVIQGGDFVYGERQIEGDPSVLTKRTGPTATMIQTAAAKYGADANVAMGIANIESGGNQGASNPNSSATGVFQITSGTAKQYGIDPTDKAQNIDGGVRLTKDNTDALRKATGKDPTPGNVYLAHFLGLGAAEGLASANDSAPISDYVSADAINANKSILQGKTVGDVKQWAEGKMAKAMGQPLPDWYTSQSPERQLQLERMAQARSNQLQTEARGNLETTVQNAPVAVQNTGTYDGQMPSQDQFTAAYGPREGQQRFDAFQAAVQTGRDIFDMKTMPATDIQQMVQDARPTSSGNDAELQQKRYEAISSAAAATQKAREADPVTYVQQSFPNVQQAWHDVQQGGSVSDAISATTAAEQQLGIRNMQVLPKEVAKQSVDEFKKPDATDDQRLGAVTSLVFATKDPSQQRAIFNQMVDAGLPPMLEGAVEAYARGDQGAARRLMQAAIVKPGDLPKDSSTTPKTISDTIYSNVWSSGQVGDVAYGLSYGDASSLERAQRGTDLMNRAVQLRMAQGEDLQTAVGNAKKDLFGDVTVYDGGAGVHAELTVPSDTDTNILTRGLDQAKSDFALALTDQRDRIASRAGAGLSEESALHQGAYERNKQWVKPGVTASDFQTKLSSQDEAKFEAWVKQNNVPFDPSAKGPQDYDMRGFWKGLTTGDPHAQTGVDANDGKLHYTDYWKTPYHESFSRESKFATQAAPDWNAQDQLVGSDGKVYFDDKNQAANRQALIKSGTNFRPSDGTKAIFDAATSNRMNDVIQNGVFVSVGNGIGLRDPYTGQFVTDVDGKTPMTIPLNDILKKGAGATRGQGQFDKSKAKGAYDAGMSQIQGWTGQ